MLVLAPIITLKDQKMQMEVVIIATLNAQPINHLLMNRAIANHAILAPQSLIKKGKPWRPAPKNATSMGNILIPVPLPIKGKMAWGITTFNALNAVAKSMVLNVYFNKLFFKSFGHFPLGFEVSMINYPLWIKNPLFFAKERERTQIYKTKKF